MLERSVCRHEVEDAIADAPIVLTPSHFVCIGSDVGASYMVVNADLGAA